MKIKKRMHQISLVCICMVCFFLVSFSVQAQGQLTESILLENTGSEDGMTIQGQIIEKINSEETESIYQESLDQIMGNIDFTEINEFLHQLDTEEKVDFVEIMKVFISQEGQVDKKWFLSQIWSLIAAEIQTSRPIFVQILVMCAAFGLLNNFALVFKNSHIHSTCFYIFYLAMITFLMKAYLISSQLLISVMDNLIEFMQVLMPAFCMSLAFSSAVSSAAVFYQIILGVIYLIERIIVYFVVPAVHIYVVFMMLNLLTEEDMISGITNLLQKGINWSLKIMIGAITGINVLQNLIVPAVDSLKNTAVTKVISAIPGVGSAVNAVTSTFFGAAVVIKNGIGVTAIVVLLLVVLSPVVKLGILTVLYKLTGAVVQPIADKKVCRCIGGVGEGVKMLLQIIFTALLLFTISIAMVTASVRA